MDSSINQPHLLVNVFINEQGEVIIPAQQQSLQVEERVQQPPSPQLSETDVQDILMEQPEHPQQGNECILGHDYFLMQLIKMQPSLAIGFDQGIVNPHSLTQILELYTQTSSHPLLLPLKRKLCIFDESKGVSAFSVLNKDVFVVNPAALSPSNMRLFEIEEPANLSVFSQKSTDLQMTNQFSLSVKATCIEFNTESNIQQT